MSVSEDWEVSIGELVKPNKSSLGAWHEEDRHKTYEVMSYTVVGSFKLIGIDLYCNGKPTLIASRFLEPVFSNRQLGDFL